MSDEIWLNWRRGTNISPCLANTCEKRMGRPSNQPACSILSLPKTRYSRSKPSPSRFSSFLIFSPPRLAGAAPCSGALCLPSPDVAFLLRKARCRMRLSAWVALWDAVVLMDAIPVQAALYPPARAGPPPRPLPGLQPSTASLEVQGDERGGGGEDRLRGHRRHVGDEAGGDVRVQLRRAVQARGAAERQPDVGRARAQGAVGIVPRRVRQEHRRRRPRVLPRHAAQAAGLQIC
ncbi:hypothetical protein BRADI_2g17912v3 [Brachypodium distachyon]|uniref:Uncharacterized protein n=1 Tax=Brachypodium distachyon TaxID=15368 RepID=A0A0Q3QUK2_BRADI|nr:hypothetical protein BRADI_2g17912v3 [Brachypodium distachyon]